MLPTILAIFFTFDLSVPPNLVKPFASYAECEKARVAMAEQLLQTPGAKEAGAVAVCLVPRKGTAV